MEPLGATFLTALGARRMTPCPTRYEAREMASAPSLRRRPRLGRELGAMLAFKLLALILLYVFFFAPAHRPRLDLARLFDAPVSSPATTR